MKNTLQTIAVIALAIILLDAVCFTAWVASNQRPADGFYAGAITANILKAALK